MKVPVRIKNFSNIKSFEKSLENSDPKMGDCFLYGDDNEPIMVDGKSKIGGNSQYEIVFKDGRREWVKGMRLFGLEKIPRSKFKNGLGYEVPITAGTSITEEKKNWGYFRPGDFVTFPGSSRYSLVVGQVLEVKSPRVKVAFPGFSPEWFSEDSLEAAEKPKNDERVSNPSWMKDESIWQKAKESVGKKDGDYNWAEVTAVYKKMGGRVS